jgi:sugar phosphate isomerase/epimerase
MKKPGVALQLYTLREDMTRDYVGTLKEVAKLGYPAVQPYGYGGMAAPELRRVLDDLGLKVAGNHVGLDRLENNLDEEIEINRTLGNRDVVCPGLYPEARRAGGADTYRRFGELFARIAERCESAGLRFSYHNHAFEFEKIDGHYPLDILMGAAGKTHLEPDVYWILVGGEDPPAIIKRFSCPIIHLKDLDPKRDPSFAEVGAGVIDFEPIFSASEAGGAEWYVVEQDRCPGPALESARISIENLRRWGKL